VTVLLLLLPVFLYVVDAFAYGVVDVGCQLLLLQLVASQTRSTNGIPSPTRGQLHPAIDWTVVAAESILYTLYCA